ncbi:histidine kinase [Streptomyces sp. NPDC048606]|uniref:sensor histidine kinase n=1 Tax=Streptomyces sp. NPDC048606 TaxID=3154726 RepID=UPI00341EA670
MGIRVDRPTWTWTRNDGLVAVGAGGVDLLGLSAGSSVGVPPITPLAMLLVMLASLTLLVRRHHPALVHTAVVGLSAVLDLVSPVTPGFTITMAVSLFTLARSCRPPVVALGALAAVPLPLLGRERGLDDGWILLGAAVAAALVVICAVAMNRRQREVEANRMLLADRAVAEERRRIARELHDIVAHHITTMQLMAGGARANLAHDPEAAREALVTLEGSGRMALGEMRQLLDVLRAGEEPERTPPAPQPGTADLDRIVTESRLAGMDTEFSVVGPVRALPPTVGLTVFRVVQEALTNARKHAVGARARVRLTYRPDGVTVEVRDDGTPAASPRRPPAARPAPGGGYGLIGMRERVALQGGTLEAAPHRDGGFLVAARIPVALGAGSPEAEETRR